MERAYRRAATKFHLDVDPSPAAKAKFLDICSLRSFKGFRETCKA